MNDNKENTQPENTNSSTYTLKPVRMPWLHLLDPVTGELPENYEEILAKEKEAKNPSSLKKLKPQRINLKDLSIDPDGGKIHFGKNESATTKSYQWSLPQRKGTTGNQLKPKTCSGSGNIKSSRPSTSSIGKGGSKQRKLSADFKVSKLNPGKAPTGVDRPPTNSKVLGTGIRKRLFNESPKLKKTRVSGTENISKTIAKSQMYPQVNMQLPTSSTNDDTEALLEISLSESELSKSRTKLNGESSKLFNQLDPSLDVHSSGSSTKEFLELEQQCRTPKPKFTLANTSCDCNQSGYYIKKISNIIEQLTELLHSSNDVLDHLKNCKCFNNNESNKRRCSSLDRGVIKNKESCQLRSEATSSILTSTKKKKKDLRVDTLKKSVTFNVSTTNKDEKALDLYKTLRAATDSVLRTPKINNLTRNSPLLQNDNLSKRVQGQCLLLQQTPKHC